MVGAYGKKREGGGMASAEQGHGCSQKLELGCPLRPRRPKIEAESRERE